MLSAAQRRLLKEAVEQYSPTLIDLASCDVLALPLEQRNQLRSALGDYLSAKGFDKNWNPTSVGRAIEELIDALGPR